MLRAIDLSPLAVAKRLGSHGENALADVNRKTAQMRIAKLLFRLGKLALGGVPTPSTTFLRDHDRPKDRGKALDRPPTLEILALEKLFLK